MKTVLKYVENHYTEKLTIDDMAELTYYSKSHFMKFFKAHMGIGFTEYLNDYRLTMAARLLKSSDDSILMIADASGFDNLSYFNRIFKRKYLRPFSGGSDTFPGPGRKCACILLQNQDIQDQDC